MAQLGKRASVAVSGIAKVKDRGSDDGHSYPHLVPFLAGGGGNSSFRFLPPCARCDPDALVYGAVLSGFLVDARGEERRPKVDANAAGLKSEDAGIAQLVERNLARLRSRVRTSFPLHSFVDSR